MKLRSILSVGGFTGLGESNTCTLRDKVLQDYANVDHVDTTLVPYNLEYRIRNKLFRLGINVPLPDLSGANDLILKKIREYQYDIVWIDKGIVISDKTLSIIKTEQPNTKIIGFSPDWMAGRHNQSVQFIKSLPLYDCYVTTKSYSVEEMIRMGCKDVFYVGNSYQKGFHKPYVLDEVEKNIYCSDISFIGAYEKERAESISFLSKNGLKINIWGDHKWITFCKNNKNLCFKGLELKDESYCKALSGSKISLCFLRKVNKDLQTTRSIEIPACGSFMLAERTTEHQSLFEENKEAVYFETNEELLQKCLYYLKENTEREQIALAGFSRCIKSDYSYHGRIKEILNHVFYNGE